MKTKVLKESEVKKKLTEIFKQETLKIVAESFENMDSNEKKLFTNFVRNVYPTNNTLVNESTMNLILDVMGIFDPTGIVDVVNGFSYYKQGENLFAILSWIAALPVLGDIVAKPVLFLFKSGNKTALAFKTAVETKNVNAMTKIAQESPEIEKLVMSSNEWGQKLMAGFSKGMSFIPFIGKSISKTISELVTLFGTVAKDTQIGKKVALSGVAGQIGRKLSQEEKLKFLKGLENYKIFKDFKIADPTFFEKIKGGFPKFWGNRDLRSLFGRTMFYTGLLKWLNKDEKTTPEELSKQESNLENKIKSFANTPEGKTLWSQEMSTNKDVLFDNNITDGGKNLFSKITGISSDPILSLFTRFT